MYVGVVGLIKLNVVSNVRIFFKILEVVNNLMMGIIEFVIILIKLLIFYLILFYGVVGC